MSEDVVEQSIITISINSKGGRRACEARWRSCYHRVHTAAEMMPISVNNSTMDSSATGMLPISVNYTKAVHRGLMNSVGKVFKNCRTMKGEPDQPHGLAARGAGRDRSRWGDHKIMISALCGHQRLTPVATPLLKAA